MKPQDKFYFTAANAFHRCYSPKNKRYSRYGGRGITVEFGTIGEFAEYLRNELPGYASGMTLDRRDNDGNYARGNLQWATRQEQNSNRGIPSTNTSGVKNVRRQSSGRGWEVLLWRDGRVTSKSFADKKFGGTELAKQAAVLYLEELKIDR
jgi:hypothetical protein